MTTPLPLAEARGFTWTWRHTLIVLAVLTVFGRTATHEFTWWDDRMTIGQNARLNPASLESLRHYWTNAEYGLYVPVTYTAWWLLARPARLEVPDEFGILLNPWIFHGANVAVHAVTAVLAFALLRRLLRSDAAALPAALLFALHPVQVETVAWASGTKDLLCWGFSLAALVAYVRAIDERPDDHATPRSRAWYVLATLLAALAMLSKPTAVVLPLAAAVIDRFALGRPVRIAIRTASPWLLLSIPVALVTAVVQPAPQVYAAPLPLRPVIAADAIAFYLALVAWPMDLAIDHGRRPQWVIESGQVWFTWIVPALLAVAVAAFRRRVPLLVAAALLFVIGLLPLLGLRRFMFQYYSTVADHYLYFSMFGVALALGWLLRRFPRAGVHAAAWVVLVLLGGRSLVQAGTWRDDFTLFRHAIEVNPRSFLAHNNLGSAYWSRGDVPAAERMFRRASELQPLSPDHPFNHGRALLALGRIDEGIATLDRSLTIAETHTWAGPDKIANQYAEAARYALDVGRRDKAIEYLERAVELAPSLEASRRTLDGLRTTPPATQAAGDASD